MALVWEFVREVKDANLGNTTKYYEASAQRFYLENDQIKTDHGIVVNGEWSDIQDEVTDQQLSAEGYTMFDSEHNYNGRLHAVACKDGKIVYLMHAYKTGVRCSK